MKENNNGGIRKASDFASAAAMAIGIWKNEQPVDAIMQDQGKVGLVKD